MAEHSNNVDIKMVNKSPGQCFEIICKKEISTGCSLLGFLNSLSVYINKPHVVNRRLVGTKLVKKYSRKKCDVDIPLKTIATNAISELIGQQRINTPVGDVDLNTLEEDDCVIIRDLIPKQIDRYPTLREIIEYDFQEKKVTFSPLCRLSMVHDEEIIEKEIDEEMIYSFSYVQKSQESQICLEVYKKIGNKEDGHVTKSWLEDVLLVKISRWAEEENLRTAQTSLLLVAVDEYNKLYNQLKQKYGLKLVEVWPERTDPQKFVYEDIAIATYLLLLWKEDREVKGIPEKQSFVDLGCGNGLLVYILTREGHQGVGLDLRKRQIWDWYGPSIDLREESITPSGDTLFPQYDWLIGNHSDELTPWIPVMTARSSFSCNYFVLPCCHHDFHSKFNHREVGVSQYQTYLQFVKEVGGVCGFNVEEDTLRIPSTKRVCFVGRSRNYNKSEESSTDKKRTAYINNRCSKGNNSSLLEDNSNRKINQWSTEFQPRSNKEIPRNCQSVATETKAKIVGGVFKKILSLDDCVFVKTNHGTEWNRGGKLPLSSVAELFTSELLQELKSECGGLQTLLRNHNHIFQVTGGIVQLRDLSSDDPWGRKKSRKKSNKTNPEDYFKTTLCWFHDKHPDGCPRLPENCKYAHGLSELRPKPSKPS